MQNKIIKTLLTISLLTSQIQPNCSQGCLRCESGSCVICDGLNHFKRENKSCTRTIKENCLILSEETGNCLKCHPDAKLDETKEFCIAKSNSELNSCSIYQGTSLCRRKDQGFAAYDFIFDATFVKIDNCEENESQSTCKKCEPNFILTKDKKSCLKKSALVDEECLSFTNYECLKCQDGYFMSEMNYIRYFLENQEDSDSFLLKLKIMMENGANLPLQTCVKAKDNYCLEFQSLTECKVCKEGAFLDSSNVCQLIPDSSITWCLKYDSNLNCAECEPDYYRKNSKMCILIEEEEKIAECEIHNPKANLISCWRCNDLHKLKNEITNGLTRQICEIRTNPKHEHCEELNPSEEKCAKCKENYSLDSTEKICYPSLQNCLVENRNATSPSCTTCIVGAFKNAENNCELGLVENCITYAADVCSKCKFPFVLVEGSCEESTIKISQTYCKELHATEATQCEVCDTQFAELFTFVDPCILNENPVINCMTYNADTTCMTCHEGYTLVSNECQPNPLLEGNCVLQDGGGICTKCESGFYLDTGKCLGIESYNYQNCLSTTGTGASLTCDQCDDKSTFTIFQGRIGLCDFKNNSTHVPEQADLIANCEIYNSDATKTCKKCVEEFVWNETDGQCMHKSLCVNGIQQEELGTANNFYIINKINKCVELAELTASLLKVDNCEVYVPNFQLKTNIPAFVDDYICSKCKKGYYAVFDASKTDFYGKAHINNNFNSSTDFSNRYYPITTCVSHAEAEATLVHTKETLENCELLMKGNANSLDYYACYKCIFGYTGRIHRQFEKFYITDCKPIANCNLEKRYKGLGNLPDQLQPYDSVTPADTEFPNFPFETWLNCHQCEVPSKIPFFGISSAAHTNLDIGGDLYDFDLYDHLAFDIFITNPMDQTTSQKLGQNHNFCLDQNQLQIFDEINYFPRNCGAGMFLIDKVKQGYLDENTSMICIACRPTYKASMFGPVKYAVESCQRIDNCRSSERFNGCEVCNPGYVLQWDVDLKSPKYDTCIKSTDACLYALEDSSCHLCKDGYVLHTNGSCYLIDLKGLNTEYSNNIFQMDNTGSGFLMDYFVFNRRKGLPGSYRCDRGHQLVEVEFTNKKICMKNPNLYLDAGITTDENSIDNCKLYKNTNDNSLQCQECLQGYVVDTTSKFCFEDSRLIHCKQATDFYNCSVCVNGYFLNNTTNNCNKGKIWGCSEYISETQCNTCYPGYIKLNTNNTKCFLLPDIECAVIDDTSGVVVSKTVTCQQCQNHFFMKYTTNHYKICLPFRQKLQSCKVASSQTTQNECEECEMGYYLDVDQKICKKSSEVPNCEEMSKQGDFCLECELGYYRSDDFKICTPNPTGVQFCELYETTTTCKKCMEYRYLFENKCLVVPAESIISNCLYYLYDGSEVQCEKCENNYYLKEDKCVDTIIRNCMEFESNMKCLKCIKGHSLYERHGILTCQKIDKLNCQQVNSFNFCIKCDNGFYPDIFGNCKQVFDILAGCEEYLDFERCFKCVSSKILSEDRKFCVSFEEHQEFIDQKCENQQINKLMRCNRCKIGYYFDQAGKCTQCQTGDGCLYCDNEVPTVCLFCKSGYFMDSSGQCTFDVDLVVTEEVTGEVISNVMILVGILFWMI